MLYHRINANPNTFSGKMVILETRLLGSASPLMLKCIDAAVCETAKRLCLRRNLVNVAAQPPANLLEHASRDDSDTGLSSD